MARTMPGKLDAMTVLPKRHHPIHRLLIEARIQWQARIPHHDAGESIRVVDYQPQANQSAPILTEERDIAEVIGLEPSPHPIDLPLIAEVFACGRFV